MGVDLGVFILRVGSFSGFHIEGGGGFAEFGKRVALKIGCFN